ncbi:hypothetical protein G5C66_07845 [Nocardioides sp. KC13]|uniref:DUF3168 domain-containing protein n=1 Tax=Nocardioides turkmenicus TaxID=2711220 RepID=A0A6M1R4S5_9ACTN|nr:hypothetical protein [Nocardioides sp. KC13]NGN92648.1 hypothetical protein [Nocardioides sp. KC13]
MTAREDIAAAASTVTGLKVTPYYRQNLTAGNGFVRFGERTRPSNGFGWLDTWEIWIASPADIEAAEKWIEANQDALLAALDPAEMLVTSLTPSELVLGSVNTPGIVVRGVRGA